ncbi:radical SAM protein [Thiospirochaeta perfilievii]|uniref:Radical SAM protein n=1 Tax=Thiospirochaeta perfilievii TaxID=252967 RepID=A0A5C1QDX8_9SPIO|nr:radical SAM protein [Thiospirochaeta perfilievii]QEN04402.1 radical SAM protein [Thiospirochaeta perfilievii]
MLSLEVTTRCNLRCLNCFAHEGGEFSDISYKLAEDALNEGKELGYSKLSITGGEPLLWLRLFDLLDYAFKIGYKYILVNSNGHLFTQDICKRLKKYGDKLHISCTINGDKKEHDNTRGSGSYNKVINGVKTGLKFGLNIYIYTVITSKNLESLPYFTQNIFRELKGIKTLLFIQLRGVDNDYYKVDGLKITETRFIEFVNMVAFLSLAVYKVEILENSLATVVAKKLKLKWFPKSPDISREGKVVILQNGNITFNHSSNVYLGKYNKGKLKETLSSKTYLEGTREESISCKTCKYIKICRNSGKLRPSDDYHNTGDTRELYCKKVLDLIP